MMQRTIRCTCQSFKLRVMRKISLILFVMSALWLQSCLKDKIMHTYTIATPVYAEKAVVYANIKSNNPEPVKNPGKIYLYGNYIFLNELDKGVHIIDNSNPAAPVQKAFINIPGNLDIVVKDNILYADLFSDLVVVDISNPLAARFVKFLPHIFPSRSYGNGFIADSNRVIVDWIKRDTTVRYEDYRNWYSYDMLLYSSASPQSGTAANGGIKTNGIAGSMARFSLVNDYMYCLNNYQLRSFDVTNPIDPQQVSAVTMPWNIETIYPFRDKLFIGSTTGMFIYNISNPAQPVQEGVFQHARACDPVITDGVYAYVTLRDGTMCNQALNQLDVVDLANMASPALRKSYAMTNPHGLSKDGNILFICDGRDGLKIYNAANPVDIKLLKHIKGMDTYDAIAWNNNLLVVAKDGLYQYNYSNQENITLRSKITVNR